MSQGIYQIRNILNGRVYVGSALIIERRWIRHKKDLRAGKHHAAYLQRSWTKHGAHNFAFEIVEVVDQAQRLIEIEQRWIDKLKAFGPNGYNSRAKADSPFGCRHTPEARAKISAAMKIVANNRGPITDEVRKIFSEAQQLKAKQPRSEKQRLGCLAAGLKRVGTKMSDEAKRKMSEWRTGRPVSEIQRLSLIGRVISEAGRLNIGLAKRGIKQSPEHVKKRADAHRGQKRTPEQRQRMSEAAKARCARAAK